MSAVSDLASLIRPGPEAARERRLMHSALVVAGFEHALESLGTVVAVVALEGLPEGAVERRMERLSQVTEHAVLDTLARVAADAGWSPR